MTAIRAANPGEPFAQIAALQTIVNHVIDNRTLKAFLNGNFERSLDDDWIQSLLRVATPLTTDA